MAAGDIIVIRENSSGRKGNYYQGSDDYVLHDNHAVERQTNADEFGTYTAWIYVNDLAGNYTILSAGDNGVNEYFYLAVSAGKLEFKLYQAGATQAKAIETTAGSISARTWHHIAVRNNDVRLDLFVDGVKLAVTDTGANQDAWYDIVTGADKFGIGILEVNTTHLNDFLGAIGQVKYWYAALSDAEIMNDAKGITQPNATVLDAVLRLNVTYEDDGITDSGLGADNGTLTGNAYYGGYISDWSYKLAIYSVVTGHAAEFINTFIDGSQYVSILKKGD